MAQSYWHLADPDASGIISRYLVDFDFIVNNIKMDLLVLYENLNAREFRGTLEIFGFRESTFFFSKTGHNTIVVKKMGSVGAMEMSFNVFFYKYISQRLALYWKQHPEFPLSMSFLIQQAKDYRRFGIKGGRVVRTNKLNVITKVYSSDNVSFELQSKWMSN